MLERYSAEQHVGNKVSGRVYKVHERVHGQSEIRAAVEKFLNSRILRVCVGMGARLGPISPRVCPPETPNYTHFTFEFALEDKLICNLEVSHF